MSIDNLSYRSIITGFEGNLAEADGDCQAFFSLFFEAFPSRFHCGFRFVFKQALCQLWRKLGNPLYFYGKKGKILSNSRRVLFFVV